MARHRYISLIAALLIPIIVCCGRYHPILKLIKRYPQTDNAEIVTVVPEEAIFIGTIKMVPRDEPFPHVDSNRILFKNLIKCSAKAGARYIYIISHYETDESWFIEAELYR